ncbi:hypothetical protein D3C80_2143360 [compost metagenome]
MSGSMTNSSSDCGVANCGTGAARAVTGPLVSSDDFGGMVSVPNWLRIGSFEATITPVAIWPSGMTPGLRSPLVT